ncbi:hypothetical protein BGZ98_004484 [Dissophora globulifera]|nr:hypothetical protein BGZ98_004484 [Dissophora globulifera]
MSKRSCQHFEELDEEGLIKTARSLSVIDGFKDHECNIITQKLSNTYNSTVGGAKETIGHAVGSEGLAGSGAAQKASAQTAQANQNAETRTKGIGHNIEGAAQKVVGGATNDHSMEARGHGNSALGDVQRTV